MKMDKETRHELLLVSGILGITLLVYRFLGYGFSYLLSYLVYTVGINYTYNTANLAQIAYTVCTVLLPFLAAWFLLKKVQKTDRKLPLVVAEDKKLFWPCLGIGFAGFLAGNVINSYFVLFMNHFGITFDSADLIAPETLSGYLWLTVSSVIVPAFVEELAIRGVVLQSLRKYGDAFAICFSALLFALMHGNMTQALFAFLLGLVFGALVVHTESLWTSIFVHLMNNTYAVVITLIQATAGQSAGSYAMLATTILGTVIGVLCAVYLVLYYPNKGTHTLKKPVRQRDAWLWTLLSLPMPAAIGLLVYDVAATIHVL